MRIALIGTGRMGFAQARLARYFGDSIVFAVDLNEAHRQAFAETFGVDTYVSFDEAPCGERQDLDLIWLTVTDGQIGQVARSIRESISVGTVCFHTSGALPVSVIAEELPNNPCGSLHPLVSCPLTTVDDEVCLEVYRGVVNSFEGDKRSLEMAKLLTHRLNAELVNIPEGLKPLYHAAAVFASNYPLTLIDVSSRMFQSCGFSEQQALMATERLMLQAVHAVETSCPVDALTGPVKRRDLSTIEAHQEKLQDYPDELDLYNALLRATKKMTHWDQ